MIIIGVILMVGLLAAASKSGKYTLPFMIMVLLVVFFFKRFERYFSGSETAWRNFRDNAESTPLDAQLPQLEAELTGETIEWSDVIITDNFLIWPKDIEQGKIVKLDDITKVYAQAGQLLCDTSSNDIGLVITEIEEEMPEISEAIRERKRSPSFN